MVLFNFWVYDPILAEKCNAPQLAEIQYTPYLIFDQHGKGMLGYTRRIDLNFLDILSRPTKKPNRFGFWELLFLCFVFGMVLCDLLLFLWQ